MKMTCAEFEILLCDYLDGTLDASRKEAIELHQQECAACAELAQDAADAAPFLYTAGGGWSGARRQAFGGLPSFYAEGTLIWLDADVTMTGTVNPDGPISISGSS